jgi:hypothetical protein
MDEYDGLCDVWFPFHSPLCLIACQPLFGDWFVCVCVCVFCLQQSIAIKTDAGQIVKLRPPSGDVSTAGAPLAASDFAQTSPNSTSSLVAAHTILDPEDSTPMSQTLDARALAGLQ